MTYSLWKSLYSLDNGWGAGSHSFNYALVSDPGDIFYLDENNQPYYYWYQEGDREGDLIPDFIGFLSSDSYAPFAPGEEIALRSILGDEHAGEAINFSRVSFTDVLLGVSFTASSVASSEFIFGKADLINQGLAGVANSENITTTAGDVWIDTSVSVAIPSEEGWTTLMHEIGHAFGLDHPTSAAIDNQKYTIMSTNAHSDVSGVFPVTLQLYDIAALQEIYGTRDYDTRFDANTYKLGSGLTPYPADEADPFIYTIWDGDGFDKISCSFVVSIW